jgi:quercetin dioxygenase-like cupin family protein
MSDKTVKKVSSQGSPKGALGQKYLATGVAMGMRLWEDVKAGEKQEAHARDYETIGYVIKGKAELHIEGQKVLLEPGDSWIVPKGAEHYYRITEPFTAVEVTHPPAHIHDRDAP